MLRDGVRSLAANVPRAIASYDEIEEWGKEFVDKLVSLDRSKHLGSLTISVAGQWLLQL